MKTFWLLHHRIKIWGWVILIPFLTLGLFWLYSDFRLSFLSYQAGYGFLSSDQNLTDELASIGIIIGLLIIGFSKVKNEDELIMKIRSESLLWALITNYGLVLLSVIFIYNEAFFTVMVYNMFTPLLVYVIIFQFRIWRLTQKQSL